MSAGEQRRVMIGRAMAGASEDGRGEVQMLLLDEPSNALDLAAQHDLREMLRRLAAQHDLRSMLRELARKGTAIVLITHHIADILPEMERIVMMREGRIVADGAKKDLLTEEKLGELFGRRIVMTDREGYWNAW